MVEDDAHVREALQDLRPGTASPPVAWKWRPVFRGPSNISSRDRSTGSAIQAWLVLTVLPAANRRRPGESASQPVANPFGRIGAADVHGENAGKPVEMVGNGIRQVGVVIAIGRRRVDYRRLADSRRIHARDQLPEIDRPKTGPLRTLATERRHRIPHGVRGNDVWMDVDQVPGTDAPWFVAKSTAVTQSTRTLLFISGRSHRILPTWMLSERKPYTLPGM